MKQQAWFEMAELRSRRLETAVWVPLRRSENLAREGDYVTPGTAVIAVLLAATAVIAVLLAAMRLACPRMPSRAFNSASRPESAVSSTSSCAPVVVPASIALSMRIALTIGIISLP